MMTFNGKTGFTLMEILAVILVVAVIASFLVPAVRSARAEVYYYQAKRSAIKMAEAMRSYYRDSKGYLFDTSADTAINGLQKPSSFGDCADSPAKQGIVSFGNKVPRDVKELFACNYLSWKDFDGLPYTFRPTATAADRSVLVTFTALNDKKAGRYKTLSFEVKHDMTVDDDDEEEN